MGTQTNGGTTMTCTTCGRPADDGYVNEAAGERCVDPVHDGGSSTYTVPAIGHTVERVWTMLASEYDGRTVPADVGRRRLERVSRFAFRADAELWLVAQELDGFTEFSGPTPLACAYFGNSDSPSNAWSVSASRELAKVAR